MTRLVQAPYVDAIASTLLAGASTPRRALFLDRDGVINQDHGYVHRREDTEWLPGIFDLVAAAVEAGYLPIVVTNQAGIARGLYTTQEFLAYTAWVHTSFRACRAPLLATYYCPHHPEVGSGPLTGACPCRKPAPGMIQRAEADWTLDLGASILMGDKTSDLQAGRAAGVGDLRLVQDGVLPVIKVLSRG